MKKGEIKTIEKWGFKFDVMATDRTQLRYNKELEKNEKRRVAIVTTEIPPNSLGLTKGTQILLSNNWKL